MIPAVVKREICYVQKTVCSFGKTTAPGDTFYLCCLQKRPGAIVLLKEVF